MKLLTQTRPRARRLAVCAAIAAAGLSFSMVANSQSYVYDGRTVDYVGVMSWGAYGGYVTFVGGIPFGGAGQVPNACTNGVAVFDYTQTFSKYWYMTFLTAKASGLHVLVDITQDAYNNCFIASARIKG